MAVSVQVQVEHVLVYVQRAVHVQHVAHVVHVQHAERVVHVQRVARVLQVHADRLESLEWPSFLLVPIKNR